MGGNIGQGALIGAISGGIFGLAGGIPISNPYVQGMVQIGAGAVAGGVASEISGGKFSDGFKIGGIVAAANLAVNKFFEWNTKTGEEAKEVKKNNMEVDKALEAGQKTEAKITLVSLTNESNGINSRQPVFHKDAYWKCIYQKVAANLESYATGYILSLVPGVRWVAIPGLIAMANLHGYQCRNIATYYKRYEL